MLPTTSDFVSHMVTFLQAAHLLRAMPAMPTPALNTKAVLFLKRSF
jgi:hypothetical protein